MLKILKLVTVPDQLDVALKGQMLDLKSRGFEVFMASDYDISIPYIVEREATPHFTIRFERDINIFKDFYSLIQTIRLLIKLKPDIVHTQSPKAGLIGMLAAFICGVKGRIHTVAGLPLMETKGLKRKLLIIIEKLTYCCSNSVIVNSQNLLDYIYDHIYSHTSKLKILGFGSSNGVDFKYFQNSTQINSEGINIKRFRGIEEDDFIWCFVGRIVKDKGIEELIDSFEELLKVCPNTSLILLGRFESKNSISPEHKNRLLTNPKIFYFDHQKDLRPYLSISNAFCFPSYREGLPDSLLQAATFNLPAVTTDINGCNEIIQNEVNGLLVKPKDKDDLLAKMIRLQQDNVLLERMSVNTRSIIKKRYDQETVWDLQYLEYLKLLNKK